MKIAIITEFLYNFGGIEKSILSLAKGLEKKNITLDIYCGIYDPKKTFPEFKKFKIKAFRVKKLPPIINTLYLRWKFNRLKLEGNDGFVFFGFHSIATARNNQPNCWWATQPLSYLYGWEGNNINKQELIELRRIYSINNLFIKIYLNFLRFIDQRDIKYVNKILAISENVQKRLQNAYPNKKISKIVYPPVDIKRFKYISSEDYYLSVSRLTPEKNVDKIIQAFNKMPNKKLLVIGSGPDKDKLLKLAKDNKNIQFLGFVEEDELIKLFGKCCATIYFSKGEDFGMGPIESMAAGKPSIAVNDAGFKETIVHKKTGLLIGSNIEDIIPAVKYLNKKRAKRMRKACEKRAKLFSEERFIEGVWSNLK